jgi:uncharacterized protein (DUF342 family)
VEACRNQAASRLGVSPESLELEVMQRAKHGFFRDRPFRVVARLARPILEDAERQPTLISKLDVHVKIALTEMERLEELSPANERRALEEIMANYDLLSDECRREVQELGRLLSGPGARRFQEQVARNGTFAVGLAEDKLSAEMSVSPPEGIGKAVRYEQVAVRLKQMGIRQGVDEESIRTALKQTVQTGEPIAGVTIALGYPAEDGQDGRVDFLVEPPSKEEVLRTDGSVDHRGKVKVTTVQGGQLLARMHFATPGRQGMTVCGERLPAKTGQQPVLEAGENVVFDKQSGEYRSTITGVVDISAKSIRVRKALVVAGDVDMTVGNIDFDGSVTVNGSVRDGFSVRATGEIEIRGSVEGCEIISEGGSVIVLHGVAGRGRCFISAGKNVQAKYVENATVYARGDVKVDVAVMHSQVSAGNAVTASGARGAIIGGCTKAGNKVTALTLGAPSEPPTTVLVGVSMEDQEEIRGMDQRIVTLRNAAMRLEEVAKAFESAAPEAYDLPIGQRDQYVEVRKKLVVLHYELGKVEEARAKFVDRVTETTHGTVQASREVFAKVHIRIGHLWERVESRLGESRFRIDPKAGQVVRNR